MSVRDRVARHRAEMRARGLRPVQFWVPDTRSSSFSAEVARQSAQVREFDARDDTMEFLEESAAWPEDDE